MHATQVTDTVYTVKDTCSQSSQKAGRLKVQYSVWLETMGRVNSLLTGCAIVKAIAHCTPHTWR